ncbi:MAG TPA: hypothetical protein VMT03_17960 [Polyangia bacterium]|nr:hypothetical protein [Polyangia bacterium]
MTRRLARIAVLPGLGGRSPVTLGCQDRCAPDQYAAQCEAREPPAGCGQVLLTPGGTSYACCPCN